TGALVLSVDGNVSLGDGLTNTFDGLPDLPLTRFDLSLDRSSGLVTTASDLCAPGAAPPATATLTSQAGGTVNVRSPLTVLGCGSRGKAKPTAKLSFAYRRGTGTLRARFVAARGGARLRRLRLALPSALAALGGRSGLRRVHVTAEGKAV